jgi:hypothetical protein
MNPTDVDVQLIGYRGQLGGYASQHIGAVVRRACELLEKRARTVLRLVFFFFWAGMQIREVLVHRLRWWVVGGQRIESVRTGLIGP